MFGDGIGPEIMDASLRVLDAAGADVEWEHIEVGEKVYLAGNTSGIAEEAWASIKKNKVLFKAPITTPQGGGYKSLNVTIRKTLGLYANVRPAISYNPFIPSRYPGMNVLTIRENEEDLYAGIEHQQTPEVTQCLKIITRPGCEKICQYAFEYAKAYGRKRITCMIKDNIMKLTDGLFVKVFYETAKNYPDIVAEDWIIDIGMAKLVDSPEEFDMVLMPNLYGDVATDILGLMTGSVGIAPGANVGDDIAMYEAIHGSAPRHAGKNKANPSGLLLSGVMMMVQMGQPEVAEKVHNAWLKTIEDGIVTYDLARKLKAEG
ncbi:MAG: NADP-dependent isocitrate dehydrogenase [Sulfurimonas sp.]|nr:NADP-dependent isocitrate dehydrogenase [Sulfurimonas sp.]